MLNMLYTVWYTADSDFELTEWSSKNKGTSILGNERNEIISK